MEEYIKLLDLPEEFDLNILKKAYREKVKQYHPDKASNEAERIGFEATMKKLNEANDYLKEYLENHDGKYSSSYQEQSYDNSYDESEYESENQEYKEYESDSTDVEDYDDEADEVQEYEQETENQEELIHKNWAYVYIDKKSFGGHLYFYRDKLYFVTDEYNNEQFDLRIEISKISDIEKLSFDGLLIKEKNGDTTEFSFFNRGYVVKLLFQMFMEDGNSLARNCSAFDNMNRQYDESVEQPPNIEHIFDMSKKIEALGWTKTFAIWCWELSKKNFSIIPSIIKGLIKAIFRVCVIPYILANLIFLLMIVINPNIEWDLGLVLFCIFAFAAIFPNKLLFNKKLILSLVCLLSITVFVFGMDCADNFIEKIEQEQKTKVQNEQTNPVDSTGQNQIPVQKQETQNQQTQNQPQTEQSLKIKQIRTDYLNSVIIKAKKEFASWQFPDTGYVKIKFKVSNTGQLLSYEIVESSGYKIMDDFAIKSLKAAAPFKPFPSEISNAFVNITYTFEIKPNN